MSPAPAPPPSLPMTPRRGAPELVRTCRACGCTEDYACPGGCSWVDPTLCSACHGPKQPTRAQASEIGRIEARHGPLVVRDSSMPGRLDVVFYGTPEDRQHRLEHDLLAACLVLDPRGHVVRRDRVRA